ncbi:MAG: discoidin domain-containing protein [Victivallales bacterium]|nr:discoidin domain-containing protein [Victivallales bacterium]
MPGPVPVVPGTAATRITFPLTHGGVERTITVSAVTGAGVPVAQVQTHCLDEPPLPATDRRVPIASCRTDSSYSGYLPEVLIDGVVKIADLHWTKRAWASKDDASAHWVQLDFAKSQPVAGVMVYWNREVGRAYAASDYRVVLLTETGQQVVKTVAEPRARTMDRHEWKPIQAKAIRIEQSPRGGAAHRPGIMWVREVQVLR